MKPKVFGIGFHKTGTTSLKGALTILGYRVTGPNGVHDPRIDINAHAMALRLVEEFDAFQDNPWPILFKQMDRGFPGSKFVLTVRDSRSWIASQVRHFGQAETPMRRWIYGAGSPVGNETRYVSRFESHNREVERYFEGRVNDLLVMDITGGDGWSKLCPFLGHRAPSVSFPHLNRSPSMGDPGSIEHGVVG